MAAGAVVVLGMAGYLAVTGTYRLEHGNFWAVGEGAGLEPGDRGDPQVAVHELRPGSPVRIAVTVRNPRRLAVTLTEVTFASTHVAVGEVTMIVQTFHGPQACCLPQDAQPFASHVLRHNEQVAVWLWLYPTGDTPYPPCSGFGLAEVTVRFQVLGMRRTQQLPLRTAIMFRVPCR